MDVFDFVLDGEDMEAIQALDEKKSLFFSHYDPVTVEMLTELHRYKQKKKGGKQHESENNFENSG